MPATAPLRHLKECRRRKCNTGEIPHATLRNSICIFEEKVLAKNSTGIDVMFTLSKDCENMDGAKDFIDFMMQKEQAQRYMDDQFALSAVNTATQEDPSVSVLQDYISYGKICMFADMQIPNGMDFDSALSQFCLNYSNGMDRDEAISQFLADVDEKFDTAIAQNQ